MILDFLKEQEEEHTALFHELYVRGLTCKDIDEICECIYGRQYSKQQVSFLSNACREDVNAWSCIHFSSVTWCFISMLITFPFIVIETLS